MSIEIEKPPTALKMTVTLSREQVCRALAKVFDREMREWGDHHPGYQMPVYNAVGCIIITDEGAAQLTVMIEPIAKAEGRP